MIVLDEQLLGRNIEGQIAHWYRGAVCFITDLQPHAVVKDEAIPRLLQQEKNATFVTINESDFWKKIAINNHFCVVCFALSDSRAGEIPALLRILFQNPYFNTKKKRMGKVIRVTDRDVLYYSMDVRMTSRITTQKR